MPRIEVSGLISTRAFSTGRRNWVKSTLSLKIAYDGGTDATLEGFERIVRRNICVVMTASLPNFQPVLKYFYVHTLTLQLSIHNQLLTRSFPLIDRGTL